VLGHFDLITARFFGVLAARFHLFCFVNMYDSRLLKSVFYCFICIFVLYYQLGCAAKSILAVPIIRPGTLDRRSKDRARLTGNSKDRRSVGPAIHKTAATLDRRFITPSVTMMKNITF